MVQQVITKHTATPGSQPPPLLPGELAVEMANPTRLWVGVPTSLNPLGRKQLNHTISISDFPPDPPAPGMLWWESDAAILWLYYVDADSAQWVQAASAVSSVSGGGGGAPVGDFVLKTGDTMSGNLTIASASHNRLTLNAQPGYANVVDGLRNGVMRWELVAGDGSAESGGNVGSDFVITRCADNGSGISSPFVIRRNTGEVQTQQFSCQTTINAGGAITGASLGVTGSITGASADTSGNIGCASLIARATIYTGYAAASSGTLVFGSNGSKYLTCDGTNYYLSTGSFNVAGDITGAGFIGTYGKFGPSGATVVGGFGTAGLNLEMIMTGSTSLLQSYNRTSGVFGPMNIDCGGLDIQNRNGQMNVHAGAIDYYSPENTDHGNSTTIGGFAVYNSGAQKVAFENSNARMVMQIGSPVAPGSIEFTQGSNVNYKIENQVSSWQFHTAIGIAGVMLAPGGTSWVVYSDARFDYKIDATPVDDVLSRISNMQLYRNVGPTEKMEVFVKAQEFAEVCPEIVIAGTGPEATNTAYVPEGMNDSNAWAVMYDRAGVVALQAIKELLSVVQAQAAEIENLKTSIGTLTVSRR